MVTQTAQDIEVVDNIQDNGKIKIINIDPSFSVVNGHISSSFSKIITNDSVDIETVTIEIHLKREIG